MVEVALPSQSMLSAQADLQVDLLSGFETYDSMSGDTCASLMLIAH